MEKQIKVRDSSTRTVKVYAILGALFVHKALDRDGYVVTHEPTSYAISGHPLRYLKDAKAFMAALAPLVDWPNYTVERAWHDAALGRKIRELLAGFQNS